MIEESKRRKNTLERGQSLVETALGFLFFIVVVLGVLDLGRLYFIYVALEDSAGEAAIFLSTAPDCRTATDCPNPNNAEWRARNAVGENLNWDDATITSDYPNGATGIGNNVRVTITYPYALLTPVITDIVGDDTLTLTVTASQMIVSE